MSEFWRWTERISNLWSLTEPVRKFIWVPFVGGGGMTAVLNWLGIPLWQAAIVGFCIVAALGVTFYFAVQLGRQFSSSNPGVEFPSQGSIGRASGSGYIRNIQTALLIILIVFSASQYSLLQRLNRDMDCYVMPRSLTPDQITAIATHLLEYKQSYDVTFVWPRNNDEAGLYALDFRQAFEKGNWLVKPDLDLADKGLQQGMSLHCYSNGQTQTADNKRRPKDPRNPCEIAHEAVTAAVQMGSGSASNNNLKDGEYVVVFTVGPRPLRIGCEEEEEN